MCEICLHSPCLSGCPNAPDPPTVWKCEYCGESIVVGDEYVEIDGDHYHRECAQDEAYELLLEKCGAKEGTAELEDL